MTDEPTVLTRDEGSVRVVTLNRPTVKNAIDLVLRIDLAESLEAAMADDVIRAIVITGAGGAFCSGGDVATMRRQAAALTRPRAQAAARVTRAIWDGAKPVVAAIEGPALGGGLALALACDRVVAATDAVLGAAYIGVGIAGDMGIFASLPARIGPAAAKQLLMMPRRILATEACELGMVDATCEPGTALATALEDARSLAAGPPLALAAIKSMLAQGRPDPHAVLDLEVEHQAVLFDTDDFAEGIAAFAERRRPEFRGT